MATKMICDRCGAEINPRNSASCVQIKNVYGDIDGKETELCVSCTHQLKQWLEPLDRSALFYPDGVRGMRKE